MNTVIGWVSVLLGVLWLVWPKLLRGWLVGKTSWTLYWMLVFYFFFPVAAYMEQWGLKGWVALGIGLIVFGGLLRELIGKVAERLPLVSFRVMGALNVASGLYLVFFKAA